MSGDWNPRAAERSDVFDADKVGFEALCAQRTRELNDARDEVVRLDRELAEATRLLDDARFTLAAATVAAGGTLEITEKLLTELPRDVVITGSRNVATGSTVFRAHAAQPRAGGVRHCEVRSFHRQHSWNDGWHLYHCGGVS